MSRRSLPLTLLWLVTLAGLIVGLHPASAQADCLPTGRPFHDYLQAQQAAWQTSEAVYVATVSRVVWRAEPEDRAWRTAIEITLEAMRMLKGQLDDEGIWGDLEVATFCVAQNPFRGVQVGSRYVVYSGREGISPDATVIPLAKLSDPQTLMAIRGDDMLNEDSLPWLCAVETTGPCKVTNSGPVPGPVGAPRLLFQTMSDTLEPFLMEPPNGIGSVVLEHTIDGRIRILFANIQDRISSSGVRMYSTPQGPLLVLQATERGRAYINANLAYLWLGGQWQPISDDFWQDDIDWKDWGGQSDWLFDWDGLNAIHAIDSRSFADGCTYRGSVEAKLAVEGSELSIVSLKSDIRSETGGCPPLSPSQLPTIVRDPSWITSAQESMAGEQGLEP